MANWKDWQPVYAKFNLRDHGDDKEKRGATQHGLDSLFPNWVEFWRTHVVPATERPESVRIRKGVDAAVERIMSSSYAVFGDLVNAGNSLLRIRAGDLGGD